MPTAKRSPIPTELFVCLSFYLLSALVAVWVSYDPGEAWFRFGLIATGILAMVALLICSRLWGDSALRLVALLCGLLAGALGLYWLLTNDWGTDNAAKLRYLHAIDRWIQLQRPALPVVEAINPNVAGSGLATLLPLAVGGMMSAWRRKQRLYALCIGLCAGAGLFALLLTASRGAWLGLAAGSAVALYLAGRTRLARIPYLTLLSDSLLLLTPVGLAGLFFLAVVWPDWMQWLGGSVAIGSAAIGRIALWQQGLDLVGDYPFTGSGLQGPMMVHSSYVLLSHVGYISHMHNLFLEIGVQQGLPALVAFLGVYILALDNLRRVLVVRRRISTLALGAVASLTSIAVHGMVDAALFASRLVPVLFLALGFALGVGMTRREEPLYGFGLLGWTLAAALVLTFLLQPQVRAAFQANWGAALQSRSELSLYRWPQWPIQDALRRSDSLDLAPARQRYAAALALNPLNVTANRRLGQIALSLGEYDEALRHLSLAYDYAPGQRATRLLLAEVRGIRGETDEGAALLRTVDVAQSQWQGRIWWHSHLGETALVQRLREVMQLAALPAR